MKIVICGSMVFVKKMVELKSEFEKIGHEIVLPRFSEEYAQMQSLDKVHSESVKNKINHDLIKDHFESIKNADAVLIVNEDKNEAKDYIGGNSFLEMGFAHVLNKKIFLLNGMPKNSYVDEIKAMQPIVLNNDLSLIVH